MQTIFIFFLYLLVYVVISKVVRDLIIYYSQARVMIKKKIERIKIYLELLRIPILISISIMITIAKKKIRNRNFS